MVGWRIWPRVWPRGCRQQCQRLQHVSERSRGRWCKRRGCREFRTRRRAVQRRGRLGITFGRDGQRKASGESGQREYANVGPLGKHVEFQAVWQYEVLQSKRIVQKLRWIAGRTVGRV